MTNRTNLAKQILLSLFFIAILLFVGLHANATHAAGLVPCGNNADGSDRCNLCYLIVGFHGLVTFLLGLLVTVALAGIFFAGVMYIVSAGDEGMMTTAKNFARASVTGFAVVLGAWLIVNVVMWAMSARTDLGISQSNWYTFNCSTTNSTSPSNTPANTPSNNQNNDNAPLPEKSICSAYVKGYLKTGTCQKSCTGNTYPVQPSPDQTFQKCASGLSCCATPDAANPPAQPAPTTETNNYKWTTKTGTSGCSDAFGNNWVEVDPTKCNAGSKPAGFVKCCALYTAN